MGKILRRNQFVFSYAIKTPLKPSGKKYKEKMIWHI
jgi:hypothetical protein